MSTFNRAEEIEGWKKARLLTREIYQITSSGSFGKDHGLCDQVRRAAVSIMANIAEGYGRGGNKEFVQFLGHARGSCAEVKSHLYVALDAGYIEQKCFDELYRLASETEALISGLMKYLQASPTRGRKFNTPEHCEL